MKDYQYQNLCKRVLSEGSWVDHKRSGSKRLTVLNETFTYDVGNNVFPLDTTRKSYWKAAVAEMIGYLKGYTNANDFKALGTTTWMANANENEAWLANPNREGDGDMGQAYRFRGYGVSIPHAWSNEYVYVDQFKNIIDKLNDRNDDGRLIMSAWLPHFSNYTCLEPCMYSHTFSLLGDTLHLTSIQRSVDVPLGLCFNQVQVFFLLAIVAQITGLKAGKATHHMVNCHIYDNQVDLMVQQVKREVLDSPRFVMDNSIKSLKDLEMLDSLVGFSVEGYEHHEAIKYPFTV